MFVFGFVRVRKQFNEHSGKAGVIQFAIEESTTQIERKDEVQGKGTKSCFTDEGSSTKREEGGLTQSC